MSPGDPLRQALARPKRWRGFAVRSLVTVAVLATLIVFVTPSALLEAIDRMSWLPWTGAVLGLLAGHSLAALKWRSLLRAGGAEFPASAAIRAHAAGLFANLFLPSLVGGDVVRAAALARERDGAAVATGSIADRLIDTFALGLLAAAGGAWVGARTTAHWAAIALVLGSVIAAPLLALTTLRRISNESLPTSLQGIAARIRDASDRLAGSPAVAGRALLASLGIQGGFVALNAGLGHALAIEASFGVWLLCWPLAKLVALLPISLGGIGVREAALASLLAAFAIPASLAVAQSLLWQFALIAAGAIAGGFAFSTAAQPLAETGEPG